MLADRHGRRLAPAGAGTRTKHLCPLHFFRQNWSPRVVLFAAVALHIAGLRTAYSALSKIKIVVLEFSFRDASLKGELEGEDSADRRRLRRIRLQAEAILSRSGKYVIVDTSPYDAVINKLRANQDFDECHGCEIAVGRALGADQVLVGWVLKESNLLTYLGVRIEDVHSGKVVAGKMVQIENDGDEGSRRAVSFVLEQLLTPKK
jgi:hypothetical protein